MSRWGKRRRIEQAARQWVRAEHTSILCDLHAKKEPTAANLVLSVRALIEQYRAEDALREAVES